MKMATKVINIQGIKNEFERGYDKIHAWFFAYPQDEFSLSELSRQLEISKTTTNFTVLQLEKDGFLEKKELGKLWRIKANHGHRYFITRKIAYNLKLVYECGIIEWIRENIPNAKAIVLFGSYRSGEDIPESDIDIAVEVTGNEELKITPLNIKDFGYRQKTTLNLHIFSRNKIDLNLFSSIANGIILEGFLEVRP